MVKIRKLENNAEAAVCARMMATSEPWITLGRGYQASLEILTDPGREVYLAVRENSILGFTILNMQGAFVGYIQAVCVAAEARGQGIGSQLIAYAEARIFRESPNVFICVSSFNAGAQKLYARLGYEVIGELRDYVIAGHSEFLLRKTIAPKAGFKKA